MTTETETVGAATANFKHPDGREIVVFVHQIVAVTRMPNMLATALVGPGASAIPVTDTIEEATAKIKAALTLNQKEQVHGT